MTPEAEAVERDRMMLIREQELAWYRERGRKPQPVPPPELPLIVRLSLIDDGSIKPTGRANLNRSGRLKGLAPTAAGLTHEQIIRFDFRPRSS